jgi:hypothetical protein
MALSAKLFHGPSVGTNATLLAPESGGKLQVSTEGGEQPLWSRDGRSIFFRDGRSVAAVRFEPGPPTALSPPVALFPDRYDRPQGDTHTGYDVFPDGRFLMAEPTGRVMLYDANADTWVAARQDADELSGAYAALSDDRFVVGNMLMNKSLYPVQIFESGTGLSSGFALVDGFGYDDLAAEIAGGSDASVAFLRLAAGQITDVEEASRLRHALRAYCERDTLALVEVHRALRARMCPRTGESERTA